jgi:hypothetical protein
MHVQLSTLVEVQAADIFSRMQCSGPRGTLICLLGVVSSDLVSLMNSFEVPVSDLTDVTRFVGLRLQQYKSMLDISPENILFSNQPTMGSPRFRYYWRAILRN